MEARLRKITTIALGGDPAPRGGVFRSINSPVLNNSGDVAFIGDTSSPPQVSQRLGVYLYSGGKTIAVAIPGDVMPGGGKFVTASTLTSQQIHVNNQGEVVFNAVLDTDVDHDGTADTGLFVWSKGSLRLV